MTDKRPKHQDAPDRPEIVLKNLADVIANATELEVAFPMAFSVGYEPVRHGGTEKTRRSVSNDNRGLDRAGSIEEGATIGEPLDFDGAERMRGMLFTAGDAIRKMRDLSMLAVNTLGDMQTVLNARAHEIADVTIVDKPEDPNTPPWLRGMTPGEAADRQKVREARVQGRLAAGVPFEMAKGEIGA